MPLNAVTTHILKTGSNPYVIYARDPWRSWCEAPSSFGLTDYNSSLYHQSICRFDRNRLQEQAAITQAMDPGSSAGERKL
jgi:hypothetical protein